MVPTSEYAINQSPTYITTAEQPKSTKNRINKLKFTSYTVQKEQNDPFLASCIHISVELSISCASKKKAVYFCYEYNGKGQIPVRKKEITK